MPQETNDMPNKKRGYKAALREPNPYRQRAKMTELENLFLNALDVLLSKGQNTVAVEKCLKAHLFSNKGELDISDDQDIVVTRKGLFSELSSKATKVVLLIMEELKVNNIFWYSDDLELIKLGTIAELKKHEILIPTEHKGYYIVNPTKIRRGKLLNIVMAILDDITVNRKINSTDNFKPGSKGTHFRDKIMNYIALRG